jgi:hypothetical protein
MAKRRHFVQPRKQGRWPCRSNDRGNCCDGSHTLACCPVFSFYAWQGYHYPEVHRGSNVYQWEFSTRDGEVLARVSFGTPGSQPTASQFRAPTNAAFQRQVGAVAEIEIPSTPSGGEIDLDGVELESTSARVGSASRAALVLPYPSPSIESFTWLEPYSTAQAEPS